MESPVDQIYAEAVALLDRRLDETWQEEEVIAQLKETLRRVQKKLIERIRMEARKVDRTREELVALKLKLMTFQSDQEEGKADAARLVALSQKIQADLHEQKHPGSHIDAKALETQIWAVLDRNPSSENEVSSGRADPPHHA